MLRTLLMSSLLLGVAYAESVDAPVGLPPAAAFAERGFHDGPLLQGATDTSEEEEPLDVDADRRKKTAISLYNKAERHDEDSFDAALAIPARTLDLSWGELKLDGGYIVFIQPSEIDAADLEGKDVPERKSIAAIYVGTGKLKYAAPHEAERWVLNYGLSDLGGKATDVDGIEVDLDGGALLWFNGRWRDLLQEGTKPAAADKSVLATAERMWKARADLFHNIVAGQQTEDAFDGQERGLLIVDAPTKTLKGAPAVSYFLDPKATEGVALYVGKRYALNRDVVNWTDLGGWFTEEQAKGKSERDLGYQRLAKDEDVLHYNMDMDVFKSGDEGLWGMRIDGDVRVVTKVDRRIFRLEQMSSWNDKPIKVLSLSDADGNDLDFVHRSGVLLVDLGKTLPAGTEFTIRFRTEGFIVDVIKNDTPPVSVEDYNALGAVAKILNFRLPIGGAWYPMTAAFSDAATFDWTLRLPEPMIAATSGTLLSMTQEGKTNVHVIKETVPVFFPAIVFGRFTVRENEPDWAAGEKKIRVYMHPGFDKEGDLYIAQAQSIMAFYKQLYGSEYPYQELDIVQMPIGVGYAQAPSGLVQMDGAAYVSKTTLVNTWNADSNMLDIRDNFIPHEIAHYWWGHLAGWAHDRDQWASETLSEFSAALFLEERESQAAGDPNNHKGYEDRRDRWGVNGRMGHTFKRTGPLWVGNRTGTRRTSTIYARGPLVMDMLRSNFGKEAVLKFMYTLNQLSQKHENKLITEDVQAALEATIPGVKFDEFMAQYIKGNEPLPTDPNLKKAEKAGRSKF